MTSIAEGAVTFTFQNSWTALQFDRIGYYRKLTGLGGSNKAVDIAAFDPDSGNLWLIEVKDYRTHPREKQQDIVDELAQKVRDSLAVLIILRVRGGVDYPKMMHSILSGLNSVRIVLHVEQRAVPGKLHPYVVNPKTTYDLLRRALKRVDNTVQAASISCPQINRRSGLPWAVALSGP